MAWAGNSDPEERLSDGLLVAGAAAAFLTTFAMDDPAGRPPYFRSLALTLGATYGLKLAVEKPRPDDSGDDSFPSAHASIGFHTASFLQRRYGWGFGVPAYLAAAGMAWSRVAVERHDGFDVLAGAAIGVASSYLFVSPWQGITVGPITQSGLTGVKLTATW